MKHNKYRNIGVLFESMIHYTMRLVSEGKTTQASQMMKIIRNNFMKKTTISEAYNVFSQLLYTEAINYFHASRFYSNLRKEYNRIDDKVLNAEISNMNKQIKENFNLKEVINTKIPNYKLFSSFQICSLKENTYLSSKNQTILEQFIMEHLINNKELKKLSENNIVVEEYPKEQQKIDKIAMAIAFNNFKKSFRGKLTENQIQYLINFYSMSSKSFNKWVMKEIDGMVNDISSEKIVVENEGLRTKLDLAVERLKNIKEINSDNIVEVLLFVELCDNL